MEKLRASEERDRDLQHRFSEYIKEATATNAEMSAANAQMSDLNAQMSAAIAETSAANAEISTVDEEIEKGLKLKKKCQEQTQWANKLEHMSIKLAETSQKILNDFMNKKAAFFNEFAACLEEKKKLLDETAAAQTDGHE